MEVVKLSKKALDSAAEMLKNGKVIVCPTDTVYGLIVDATNEKAVEKIFEMKKRPRSKPLAVFVKNFKMAKELAEIDAEQMKILKQKWPGKYTFILKSKGTNNTIALRIPKYKFLNDLLKKVNKPLAQTSVNISGKPALMKISDILEFCKKCGMSDIPQILVIDAGNLPKSKASTIIDLTNKNIKIIRK